MIPALSGSTDAGLSVRYGRPRAVEDPSALDDTARRAASGQLPEPLPPPNATGASAQSLFLAMLHEDAAADSARVTSVLSQMVSSLDGDGDGKLSAVELAAALDPAQSALSGGMTPREMIGGLLSRIDSDRAGALPGADQVLDRLAELVSNLDRNGDGKLGVEEIRSAFASLTASLEGAPSANSAAAGTMAANAALPAPKSIYESLFGVLAGLGEGPGNAQRRDALSDQLLSRLTG